MEREPIRRRLRRVEAPGHVRFLTFSCHRRLPLLHNDRIKQAFVDRLARACAAKAVDLLAWVVMPEHVHLLVLPPPGVTMRDFTHVLKRPFAETVLRRWRQLDASVLARLRHGDGLRFWQTGGGYDRNVFSRHELFEKVRYIEENPVRRGLAVTATDYAWSSARWREGLDAKLVCAALPD